MKAIFYCLLLLCSSILLACTPEKRIQIEHHQTTEQRQQNNYDIKGKNVNVIQNQPGATVDVNNYGH